jgi:hypothetical protein
MNVNALRELMNFYDSEGLGGPPAQRSNFDGMFGGMDGDPNRSSRRMMFAERMLNNDARR